MPLAFDIQKNERTFAPLKASVFVGMALNYLVHDESSKYHIEPRTVIEVCSATGKACSSGILKGQVSYKTVMEKEQQLVT